MTEKNEQRKILVLFSSPRKKGNSATLANEIIRGAESEGANVETIRLHGMDISPCQACYACQKRIVKDVRLMMKCRRFTSNFWSIIPG